MLLLVVVVVEEVVVVVVVVVVRTHVPTAVAYMFTLLCALLLFLLSYKDVLAESTTAKHVTAVVVIVAVPEVVAVCVVAGVVEAEFIVFR